MGRPGATPVRRPRRRRLSDTRDDGDDLGRAHRDGDAVLGGWRAGPRCGAQAGSAPAGQRFARACGFGHHGRVADPHGHGEAEPLGSGAGGGWRPGDDRLRDRVQRHPPLSRADHGGLPRWRRRRPGGHPVLQQTEPRRAAGSLRGRRGGRRRHPGDPLQHPLALCHQPVPGLPCRAGGRDLQRGRGQAGQRRRARTDRGARRSGRQRRSLPSLPGARGDGGNPGRLAPGRGGATGAVRGCDRG